MTDDQTGDGLIYGYALNEAGSGDRFGWDELPELIKGSTPVWVHLDRNHARAHQWLREDSGVSELVSDALLAEDTRPRSAYLDQGMLFILRGVNLNPGANPEDMVSLRIWFEATTVVSVRIRRSMALLELPEELGNGNGPQSCPELVAEIVDRVVERIGPVVGSLDESISEVEDAVLEGKTDDVRDSLADLRRRAILLRRYIAPQREALRDLAANQHTPGGEAFRLRIREAADRVTRYIEDLDEMRDRAAVTQDQLVNRVGEETARTMYLLAIVSALFLPLGFITGLLGVNVTGIPGAENPHAFALLVLLLSGLVAVQLVLFRIFKII